MMLDRNGGSQLAARLPLQEEIVGQTPREAASDSTTKPLRVLWQRRWIIVASVVVSLVAAAIYLSKATPVYSSSSRIYVQQTGPRIMEDNVFGNGASSTFLANQVELIRSPAILSSAVALPEMSQSKTLSHAENPVGLLLSMVTVDLGKQNDILTVSAESTDPHEAALIVNGVVEAYIAYQDNQRHSTAVEILKVLQKEKDRRDAELEQLSKEMMDFKRANGVLTFADDKGNIVTQRLGELSEALSQAEMDTLNAKVMKEAVEAVGDDANKIKLLMQAEYAKGVQINVGADSGDLATRLQALRMQLALMRAQDGTEHPQVKAAQIEMDELKTELSVADQQSAEGEKAVVEQVYIKCVKKQEALQVAFDKQRGDALDLASKSAEYAKLDADERRTEKLSDLLDSRIKEINVSEDSGALNTSILQTAKANLTPVRPLPSRTLGVALVVGLMVGFAGALGQDWMDQRLRSAEDIAAYMDLQVLGLVPSMSPKETPAERGMEVHLRPQSEIAEAYRTLRTAVYFGSPAGRCKTLLVTSPSPGDGKSTVASNLSIAMAQAGGRILLLDADCRRPMQHKIFSLGSTNGLSTILTGGSTIELAIQPSGVANLDILPCGPLPTNPAEVMNSLEFSQLLDELSSRYDQVVLDSPPVVPVTDARILSACCDVTIVVLRAERSNRRLGKHAVECLRSVGGSILGAVVNDVSRGRGGYGYAYYSDYGYYPSRYVQDEQVKGNGTSRKNGTHAIENGTAPAVAVGEVAETDNRKMIS